MTHHYIIEIIKPKLFLKATYRNKKFRKIEHLRGKLDRSLMNSIGRVIPVNEDELPSFNREFENRVNYQIEVKQVQSLYTRFLNAWFQFYEDLMELKPKFTGADGKALNRIIAYLKTQSVDEEEAFNTWDFFLSNWNNLPTFHQKNTDLKYIDSKFNILINELKTNTITSSSFEATVNSEAARNFKFK